MDWREYIEAKDTVLLGKPVIKGTRIAAEFLLELFAAGWSVEDVLESYPDVTPEALQAVFAFGAQTIHDHGIATREA